VRNTRSAILRRILGGSLIGSTAIGVSAVLEYIYFLLAGHWLDPAGFGLLSTATSILTILVAAVTSGIGTSVAKFVAEAPRDSARTEITNGSALQVVLAITFSITLLMVKAWLAPARLQDLSPSIDLILWMMPILALGAMLPLAFQGLERLTEFGLAQAANVLARIVAAAAFLKLGTGALGALAAYLPGALATSAFCILRLRSYLGLENLDFEAARRIARFSIPVSVSTILITLFVRADVVFLKLFLVGQVNEIVGQYTAPALLARGLFYLGCGLPLALLPAISASRDLRQISLGKILFATTLVLTAITVLAHFFGEALVGLFFPQKLMGLATLLTPLMIANSTLTLAYTLATVLIALGHPGAAARGLLAGFIAFAVGSWLLIPGVESCLLNLPAQGPLGVSRALNLGAVISLSTLGISVLKWRKTIESA